MPTLTRSELAKMGMGHLLKEGEKAKPEPRRGRMNKWESMYRDTLETQRLGGEVIWFRFEAVKLRLATGAWYTSDFAVLTPKGLQLHEIKGFWRESARVRIKVAAELYPVFEFYAVTRDGGGWKYERFYSRQG